MEDLTIMSWVAYHAHRIPDAWSFAKSAALQPDCTFPEDLQDTLAHLAKLQVNKARTSLAAVKGMSDVLEAKLVDEAQHVCMDVLDFIELLIHNCTHINSLPFLWKMRGDFLRYSTEFGSAVPLAVIHDAYSQALHFSIYLLPPCHHVRLGSAFTLGKLYYDYFQAYNIAIMIAKRALTDAAPWQSQLSGKELELTGLLQSLLHHSTSQFAIVRHNVFGRLRASENGW